MDGTRTEFEGEHVVLASSRRSVSVLESIGTALLLVASLMVVGGTFSSFAIPGLTMAFGLALAQFDAVRREAIHTWGLGRRRKVRASSEGLSVDGELVLPAADLSRARYVAPIPRGSSSAVFIVRVESETGLCVDIEVPSEKAWSELIRALGHDGARPWARFRASQALPHSQRLAVVIGVIALVVGLQTWARHLSPLLLMSVLGTCIALASILARWRRPFVDVGADGIHLTERRKRRWISFDEVRSVEMRGVARVRLALASEDVDLEVKEAVAFVSRVREAIDARTSLRRSGELATTLARGERDDEAWRNELRRLRDQVGGYRAHSLRDEDLWRVVEDPAAEADARVAAAYLLRHSQDATETTTRVRIAAEAVAAPHLRIALEADEPEQMLEQYLARRERRLG